MKLKPKPKKPNGATDDVVQVPRTEYDDLKARVELLWTHTHPTLRLFHTYGQELIPLTPMGEVILPDDPKAVHQWPWRQVQQWYVRCCTADPGPTDNTLIRAHLVGQITGWKVDRARNEARNNPPKPPAPKPMAASPIKTIKVVRPKAHRIPNPD